MDIEPVEGAVEDPPLFEETVTKVTSLKEPVEMFRVPLGEKEKREDKHRFIAWYYLNHDNELLKIVNYEKIDREELITNLNFPLRYLSHRDMWRRMSPLDPPGDYPLLFRNNSMLEVRKLKIEGHKTFTREEGLLIPWTFRDLSRNPYVSLEFVEETISGDWNFTALSSNRNLTIEFIRNYRDKMDWDLVSVNPVVTIDMVMNNQDLPWSYSMFSENPSVTLDVVDANPDIPWNYYRLSYNKNLTWEYVLEHIDEDWSWRGLSSHPNITFDIITANENMPWALITGVMRNPNITLEDYKRMKVTPCHKDIASNEFIFNDVVCRRKRSECTAKRKSDVRMYSEHFLIPDLVGIVLEYVEYD